MEQSEVARAVAYVEKGRQKFRDLVATPDAELAEALWAMDRHDLRAIVFERVLAEQAKERG